MKVGYFLPTLHCLLYPCLFSKARLHQESQQLIWLTSYIGQLWNIPRTAHINKRDQGQTFSDYTLIGIIYKFLNVCQARIQRGGPGIRTPLRFVRGGVLCRGLMGRRGGPTVVFTLLLSIFSGSLRSPVLYKRITYIHTVLSSSIFSHPFSILPLSLWRKSTLPSLAFMKGHLCIFLVLNYTILHH